MVLIVASDCFMVKVDLSGRVRGTMSVWASAWICVKCIAHVGI